MASPQRSLSQSQDGSIDEEEKHEKALSTVDFEIVSGISIKSCTLSTGVARL